MPHQAVLTHPLLPPLKVVGCFSPAVAQSVQVGSAEVASSLEKLATI